MSVLLESLAILRQCSFETDDAFCTRVRGVFRREYERLLEEHELAYLTRVIDGQMVTAAAISKFLGYKSRSVINAIKKGSISLEKFHLLKETLSLMSLPCGNCSSSGGPLSSRRKKPCTVS